MISSTSERFGTTLVFVQSSPGPLDGAASYLLTALESKCSETIHAVPDTHKRYSLVTEGGCQVLHFPEGQQMDGVLRALSATLAFQPERVGRQILLVSDQLLGPLGNLDDLWLRLNALTTPLRLIFSSDPAFSGEPGTEELGIPVHALQVERGALFSPGFQAALGGSSSTRDLLKRTDQAGFPSSAAYEVPDSDYFLRGELTSAPLLPWDLFTTDPLLLERWAVSSRPAHAHVRSSGYPSDLFWDHLTHAVPPQTWYTNLALLDVPSGTTVTPRSELSTAVCAHIYYPDMAEEMVTFASHVPSPVSLFITTATTKKQEEIEASLLNHAARDHFESIDVRVVSTNDGRDISAFLVDCADVIRDSQFDIIVKLHSKKSVQDPHSVSSWFQRHLFENLLASTSHVSSIYQRFATEPQLGMVFPPVIHMGLPTMGNGWTANRLPAEKLAPRLGIDIPFDSNTPLSPYGSMFIARREPLLPLVEAGFTPDEYPPADNYRDGSLAHVLERLYSYVVFSQGYFARCVQTPANAEISATTLEYKLDAISAFLHPHVLEQVKMFGSGSGVAPSVASLRSQAQRQLVERFPRLGTALTNAWLTGKRTYSRLRSTRRQ